MDVERVQKINDLAVNLMKQGLADDRETAIQQAEKIFKERDSSEFSEMRETMQEMKKETEPLTNETELSQDEIKDILKQNTDFVVKKFKEFQEKIVRLEKEIATLRTQMTYSKLPTAEQVKSKEEITVKEAVDIPPVQENKEETEKEDPPKAPSHPRSGNYNEDDVSIEKFFYMGTK